MASLDDATLINKYYISGSAFALSEEKHHDLKQAVSAEFDVEYTSVFLVGSAKLGFSIKPSRRFMPFADTSDIDIVIISRDLFEKVWQEVYSFKSNGGYWPKMTSFMDYHFEGWIRPDLLPLEPSFVFSRRWWDFFENISGGGHYGPYKIYGGLYYSRYFLEHYQSKCFEQCRAELNK
ncbi:MAG TPA: hypothetical protein PKE17_19725 [Saprospiraceae bacterium]|nr:hypothetical protein [Saprospiraceae bacterium]